MRSPRPSEIEDRSRLLHLPRGVGAVWVSDLGPVGAVDAEGDGPLLFVHGLLTSGYEWWQVAERLSSAGAGARRTIALDLPGCGNSDRPPPAACEGYSAEWLAEACVAVLDALHVARARVVGHQFGGAVAITLAARHPRRVSGLVLIAPWCVVSPPSGWRALWRHVGRMPFVGRTLFRRAALRRFLAGTLATPELLDDDEVDVHWDRLARDGGLEAARAMLEHCVSESDLGAVARTCGEIEAPTLVVWGDGDGVLPPATIERVRVMIPGSRIHLIEGCGHAPQRERPQALVDAIERWETALVAEGEPPPH